MIRYVVILGLVMNAAWADYSFRFVCRDDTVARVAPGEPAYFHFALTNTGTASDVYAFDCRVRQNPPNWAIAYCVRGRCVEPGTVMYDSLAPGATDTTPVIDAFTNANVGEAVVELHVRSQQAPTLADSITVHVLAGVGIAEQPAALPRPEPVLSGLVWPGTLLRVDGLVSLHDVTGRLVVRGISQGGQWRLPLAIQPGVYVVSFGADGVNRSERIIIP